LYSTFTLTCGSVGFGVLATGNGVGDGVFTTGIGDMTGDAVSVTVGCNYVIIRDGTISLMFEMRLILNLMHIP